MNTAVEQRMRFLDSLTRDDGESYGRNLDPWQREDLLAWFEGKRSFNGGSAQEVTRKLRTRARSR